MPASKDVFGSKVNLLSQGMTTNFTPKNSLTVLGQAMACKSKLRSKPTVPDYA